MIWNSRDFSETFTTFRSRNMPTFAEHIQVKTARLEGQCQGIGFADLFAWGPAACE